MNALEALQRVRNCGVRVSVSGTDLILCADQEPERHTLEAVKRHKAEIMALLTANRDDWTAKDWQVFYDERAGIAEFDGRQPRKQAERLALESCVVEWLSRHPCSNTCQRCAPFDDANAPAQARPWVGADRRAPGGCHSACGKARERQQHARNVLAALGLPIVNTPVAAPDKSSAQSAESPL